MTEQHKGHTTTGKLPNSIDLQKFCDDKECLCPAKIHACAASIDHNIGIVLGHRTKGLEDTESKNAIDEFVKITMITISCMEEEKERLKKKEWPNGQLRDEQRLLLVHQACRLAMCAANMLLVFLRYRLAEPNEYDKFTRAEPQPYKDHAAVQNIMRRCKLDLANIATVDNVLGISVNSSSIMTDYMNMSHASHLLRGQVSCWWYDLWFDVFALTSYLEFEFDIAELEKLKQHLDKESQPGSKPKARPRYEPVSFTFLDKVALLRELLRLKNDTSTKHLYHDLRIFRVVKESNPPGMPLAKLNNNQIFIKYLSLTPRELETHGNTLWRMLYKDQSTLLRLYNIHMIATARQKTLLDPFTLAGTLEKICLEKKPPPPKGRPEATKSRCSLPPIMEETGEDDSRAASHVPNGTVSDLPLVKKQPGKQIYASEMLW